MGLSLVFPALRSAWSTPPCSPDSQNKCIELSGASITSSCQPAPSNDCNIKDATVVQSGEIAPLWQGLKIGVRNLPSQSWYRVEKNSDAEYVVVVYPNVGKHYILGSHDFEINIEIRKTERKSGKIACTVIPSSDAMGDQKFENSSFDIEVKHRLNYFYNDGPGSNPNPYTGEVRQILKKVVEGIRIGAC